MKNRCDCDTVGIEIPFVKFIFYDREGVRDGRDLQAVLLHVFTLRAAHEGPTVDQFHTGKIGEEME